MFNYQLYLEELKRLRSDWRNWAIVGLAISTALFFCLWWFHRCTPCNEGDTVTVRTIIQYRDTGYVKADVKPWNPDKQVPKKKWQRKPLAAVADLLWIDEPAAVVPAVVPSPCDTVNIKSDTISGSNKVKAIINDTLIDNHIAGRSVWLANTKPDTVTIIETQKTIKEKWKVYLGPSVTIPQFNLPRWDIGLTGALSIPKVGMISYGYAFRNNAHTFSVMPLLRFKK